MNAATSAPEASATQPTARKATKDAASASTNAAGQASGKVVGHITPAKAVLAQYENNSWRCVAAPGTMPEDLDMNPGPFDLIAQNLTRFDDLRVVDDGGKWLADLIVVDHGPGYAICRLVRSIELPERRSAQADRVPAGFEIVQAGPGSNQPGWLVYRLRDGVQLNAGQIHQDRETAIRYLLDHSTVRGEGKVARF